MVRLDAVASRAAGTERTARGPRAVTLVGAVVANDDVRRRLWLADRTGGPVLPPRRRTAGEAWTGAGVELRLAPGETRALGYATRGAPVDPPLVVASSEPVDGDEAAAADGRRVRRAQRSRRS